MPRPMTRSASLCALPLVLSLAMVASADRAPSRQDADAMRRKIELIGDRALSQAPDTLRTAVTELEVNAYLVFDAKDQLPTGVIDPYVTIVGDGRLSARATVDLDAVKSERQSTGLFDPMNLLSGQLPVAATGVLHTENGMARLDLESTQVSGIRVPKTVLQQLVSYYSRTDANPDGLSLDDPFPLPARIKRIEVGKGEAVIVQ